MSATTRLLPFQPMSMSSAQLAAVSFLARYAGHTHELYAYQLRRWFERCEVKGLDPLVGIFKHLSAQGVQGPRSPVTINTEQKMTHTQTRTG